MRVLFYTGTGNSLYAAKRIGGEAVSIPYLIKYGKFEVKDDAVGIVFPCYGLGVPNTVKSFLEKAVIKADYVFAVMTYGTDDSGALAVIEKAVAKSGLKFDYMNSVKMVDNYLPRYSLESQIAALAEKRIEENLTAVVEDIKARKKLKPSASFGDKLAAGRAQKTMKIEGDIDKNIIVTDRCIRCRTCMKVCPTGSINIDLEDRWLHRCDYSMACIHNCPSNALHLPDEKSIARFRNEHVQVREIIEANRQV
jgi:ferredoxin